MMMWCWSRVKICILILHCCLPIWNCIKKKKTEKVVSLTFTYTPEIYFLLLSVFTVFDGFGNITIFLSIKCLFFAHYFCNKDLFMIFDPYRHIIIKQLPMNQFLIFWSFHLILIFNIPRFQYLIIATFRFSLYSTHIDLWGNYELHLQQKQVVVATKSKENKLYNTNKNNFSTNGRLYGFFV